MVQMLSGFKERTHVVKYLLGSLALSLHILLEINRYHLFSNQIILLTIKEQYVMFYIIFPKIIIWYFNCSTKRDNNEKVSLLC